MFIKEGETNWKFLLIAVFLAAIAGAGIFISTRDFTKQMLAFSSFPEIKEPEKIIKDETADWKIYTNQEYGFQIKYPKDWNYGPNILRSLQEAHMVFCPPELVDLESGYGCRWDTKTVGNIISRDTDSPIFLFVEDWNKLRGGTKEEKKNIAWCKLEEKKTINNIEMEFIDCDGQKRVYWEGPENAYLYKFFLADSKFSSEFNLMLSSFQFLK